MASQQKNLARVSVDLTCQQIDTALKTLAALAIEFGSDMRALPMPPIKELTADNRLYFNEVSADMRNGLFSEHVDIQAIYLFSTKNRYAIGSSGMHEDEILKKCIIPPPIPGCSKRSTIPISRAA